MSIYQYKDSARAELWRIVQIQATETEVMLKRISELEEALRNLLKTTEWVYSHSEELTAAEEAANNALGRQYE
jgi:uncharacterized membrane protein